MQLPGRGRSQFVSLLPVQSVLQSTRRCRQSGVKLPPPLRATPRPASTPPTEGVAHTFDRTDRPSAAARVGATLTATMIPHAPSDATFASLVVGLAIGLSFAIGSYIALTQSWTEQLSVVVELLRAHSVLTWAALAAAGAAFVRVGCRTWQEEVELSVEVSFRHSGDSATGSGDGRLAAALRICDGCSP